MEDSKNNDKPDKLKDFIEEITDVKDSDVIDVYVFKNGVIIAKL